MPYQHHNFTPGQVIRSQPFNEIDHQVYLNYNAVEQLQTSITELTTRLTELSTLLHNFIHEDDSGLVICSTEQDTSNVTLDATTLDNGTIS